MDVNKDDPGTFFLYDLAPVNSSPPDRHNSIEAVRSRSEDALLPLTAEEAGAGVDPKDFCNDTNSFEYEDFTQLDVVRNVFVAIYTIIIASSLIGNFMVIWTIARNRHMQTVTNYYILNLAVADFLVSLVVMPLKLIEYTAPCQWGILGHTALCPLLYYILPVFVFTSVLTLAAISIERYVCSASYDLLTMQCVFLPSPRPRVFVSCKTALGCAEFSVICSLLELNQR